ncbi:hypothetical protein Q1695_007516 [Nippostrongylus brasiliensis]|nr:hypothetical protein Q1695_007516 [Nippostrongylus brasiliensis]
MLWAARLPQGRPSASPQFGAVRGGLAAASQPPTCPSPNPRRPARRHLLSDRRCVGGDYYGNHSFFNCHGARFIASNGYFQPCNRHSHCYASREPTDWCILPHHLRWTVFTPWIHIMVTVGEKVSLL